MSCSLSKVPTVKDYNDAFSLLKPVRKEQKAPLQDTASKFEELTKIIESLSSALFQEAHFFASAKSTYTENGDAEHFAQWHEFFSAMDAHNTLLKKTREEIQTIYDNIIQNNESSRLQAYEIDYNSFMKKINQQFKIYEQIQSFQSTVLEHEVFLLTHSRKDLSCIIL
ncbi:MAG TPA: hypothetical protein VGJ00_02065 [Rhabdochlamydiaceae bacterium]|jgi:hypothetical protein